jgi:hypothetical protein
MPKKENLPNLVQNDDWDKEEGFAQVGFKEVRLRVRREVFKPPR